MEHLWREPLWILTISKDLEVKLAPADQQDGTAPVESNQRFYLRRAAEERIAAQRAMTESARQWHAQLAQQFAARAAESVAPVAAVA